MLRNIQNGKEFSREMSESSQKLGQLLSTQLPGFIADKAQQIVDDSFMREQYQDGGSSKWKGRKKDKEGKLSRSERRALLVKSGKLIKSVETEQRGADIVIGSDTPYAQVHNEGLKSGRGAGFIMPERQFMPKPGQANERLNKQVEKFLDSEMDKIFN